MGHYDEVFARVVRGFRQEKGLTQDAMGALLGTRQNDISRLENGIRVIADLDEFVLLCRVIGVTPNEILGFT